MSDDEGEFRIRTVSVSFDSTRRRMVLVYTKLNLVQGG